MKKLFLFLTLISLTCQVAFGASDSQDSQDIIRKMRKNNSDYYKKSFALSELFKYDARFAIYLRSSWTESESERERLLNIIYSDSSDLSPELKANRLSSKASLAAKMNSDKFASYSYIINEYCRYNRYKNPERSNEACKIAKRAFN